MFDLKLYLERFKALGENHAESRKLVARIASELSGARIVETDVEIKKGGEVRIKATGPRKAALFMVQKAIEKRLGEEMKKNIDLR
jgi:hypothetical protein